jgi:hypothetical protein
MRHELGLLGGIAVQLVAMENGDLLIRSAMSAAASRR